MYSMNYERLKQGFALVGAIIILVLFLTLGVFGASMMATSSQVAFSTLEAIRTFYTAEAGLEVVLYQLSTDTTFRDNPPAFLNGSISISGGFYNYSVSINKMGNSYYLSVVGVKKTIDGVQIKRAINYTVMLNPYPSAFEYAVSGFGQGFPTDVTLKNSVSISGDFYIYGGVEVKPASSVTNGYVYANYTTGSGTYTPAPGPPDPVPEYPSFDTTYYDTQLSIAESTATDDLNLGTGEVLDLNGATLYYEDINIQNDANVIGPGTLVASGSVSIKNIAVVGSNVTIIAKDTISVRNSAEIQSGAVLYADYNTGGKIELKNTADVTGSIIGSEVIIANTGSVTGLVLAQEVEISNAVSIYGSVVTQGFKNNEIKNNPNIVYNASYLPSTAPPGLQGNNLRIVPQSWRETGG